MAKSLLDHAYDFVSGQSPPSKFQDIWSYCVKESGLTPEEAFPDSRPLLETKYGKQLMDFMDSIAGKPDAVLRRSLDGIYDLIDSVAVGKVIKDGISGKDVTVDSSMVVISPAQFKALTHIDYDTYVG